MFQITINQPAKKRNISEMKRKERSSANFQSISFNNLSLQNTNQTVHDVANIIKVSNKISNGQDQVKIKQTHITDHHSHQPMITF